MTFTSVKSEKNTAGENASVNQRNSFRKTFQGCTKPGILGLDFGSYGGQSLAGRSDDLGDEPRQPTGK